MTRYVIVGGGIIGTSIAIQLAQKRAGNIVILEKEHRVGLHASGRNSGVIHSGINQKPGSLKARMCVEGSQRLREYCITNGVPMNLCGTLVIARSEQEMDILERLLVMGKECGVAGLTILTQRELLDREPEAKGMAALFSPNGAVVDSLALLRQLQHDAEALGVQYRFMHRVTGIEGSIIQTNEERFEFDHLINCAGLYADKVAHMMNVGMHLRIIPFRGEYMEVRNCNVRSMIYQPPDLRFPFLSIHLTRETDGRVLAGPSAVLSFGREAYDKQWVFNDMTEMFLSKHFIRLVANKEFIHMAIANAKTSMSKNVFLREIQSLVSGITASDVQPARSGIRAQMVNDHGKLVEDIVVEYKRDSTHVLNAVSPGMTSALAFSDEVVGRILGL